MALQTSYQSAMGFTAPTAYLRIVSFSGDKTNIICNIEIHYNKESKDSGKANIGYNTVFLQLVDGATMQQMYDALKLLPEFAGAIDV